MNPQWGIGNENNLLVRIHADMRRFRALTTHQTIIIGRKTLLSFPSGKPLPNRDNIILTRNPSFQASGATICHTLSELRDAVWKKDPESIFVCGGESVYKLLLPYCEKALVTMSDVSCPADRFFPNLNLLPNWVLSGAGPTEREGEITFRFLEYTNTCLQKL